MNQKQFKIPLPVYTNGVALKSKVKILSSRHISRRNDKTRKAKRQIVLSRPYLKRHVHCSDALCKTCQDYINKLQQWRSKN